MATNNEQYNKGINYEHLTDLYDSVYFFKDTPENIIAKTELYDDLIIYNKYKNCDIGADLVAVKDDKIYFIQCKNYSCTIGIDDLSSFYFLICEHNLNGIVYYNGTLSSRLTDLSRKKVPYNNLPFNNTIVDVHFTNEQIIDIIPRDYQIDIYNNFKTINRGILALPCGMGKTFCSWLIGRDYDNIIIISPTKNLTNTNLVQLCNYSKNTYNPILISSDGQRCHNEIIKSLKEKNIISCTYDSVGILNKVLKALKIIGNYSIFIDEYHNLSLNNLDVKENDFNELLIKNHKITFISATPIKNDIYEHIFGTYKYGYDWKNAIDDEYICDFKIIIPEDTNNIQIFKDFLKDINYEEKNKEFILKCYFILKSMLRYNDNKIIMYASNVNEAKEYIKIIEWMKQLLNVTVDANIIDNTTTKINRIKYIKQFKINNDAKQILLNVQILNEGIDIPECDSVFITKPNENIINIIQRMCRCNRIMPTKNTSNVYLWCTKIHKVFKHINMFMCHNYDIKCVKYDKKISNNIVMEHEQLTRDDVKIIPKVKKTHICERCLLIFKKKSAYISHMNRKFKCVINDDIFLNEKDANNDGN
jgi:superfamily II DNA or RNA helicase